MKIAFSPPDITELEIQYVADALRSGWITTGPRTKELEQKIAAWVGTPKCVCLNSQTACGEMSLRLLGIGPGDEVITCAYTYTASASVIAHVGAKIVLVDCQPNSLEMDYTALEAAITPKTKAIIPIDLAGIPCDYDKIFAVVERQKAKFQSNNNIQRALGRIAVVADAAHALGGDWHRKKVGATADFANYSFHAVKNFTTAEGGAMVWRHIEGVDDEELYHQAQLFSLHGQSKDALAKNQLGAWEYDIVGTWYKCNMTDIMAGIGLAQFERYPQLLARRKEIIEHYDKAFRPMGLDVLTHYTDEYASSGHLYLTRVSGITAEQRNAIIINIAERGIATNVHYKPLPMHTAYKQLGFNIKDYPNAYARFANEITLPLHTKLTDAEIEYIINNYIEVLKGYLK
ncbi:MAG: DegT/DnrJ/EryC1/StrS family aminotransferase [Acidaminococcaceae bacterium]|nr:DegT/DnrJ/EryC1/StrS family aminotransferase [Acidaminococcaceae bacterium]